MGVVGRTSAAALDGARSLIRGQKALAFEVTRAVPRLQDGDGPHPYYSLGWAGQFGFRACAATLFTPSMLVAGTDDFDCQLLK